MNTLLLDGCYLIATILFILGIRSLSSPQTARQGMFLAEAGMLLAIVGTLIGNHIVQFQWILIGLTIGSAIGAALAIFMPMTAMPQRIAVSHSFGALAAVLVGIVEYSKQNRSMDHLFMAVVGFEVLVGALTITGSLMAFGKLQNLLPGAPITYRLQNGSNLALLCVAGIIWLYLIIQPDATSVFYIMLAAGLAIGVLIVMPIGGADMPVVLSLLNSYAGLASAATGFALDSKILIIAGALDGTSGFVLSMMMSRAMHRSFANVLFGAVGATRPQAEIQDDTRTVIHYTAEDAAYMLSSAQSVIIIPGYGMAVAQAQHAVQELASVLMQRGTRVRFAIHPVAGRMPGHMNVLLAEATIPYDLLFTPEQINDDFPDTDVALVIGANDIVNPAARTKQDSPLYGMPILDADKAHTVMVLKRSLAPGFSGEDNPLFYLQNTMMVFGDAKATLTALVQSLKATTATPAEGKASPIPVTASSSLSLADLPST
jgi:NAD(P) transhydrogenase subunit beta